MAAPRRAGSPVMFLASVLVALTVAGCEKRPDQDGPPIPDPAPIPEVTQSPETSPAPGSPTPAPGGSGPVISGSVWDTAFRSLDGARVEILDGTHAGLSTVTDAAGRFVLRGLFASPTTVRASKDGYAAGTKVWSCSGASCSDPGPVLGFFLNVLAPSVDLAGNFTVTISAAPACADLPAEARARSYAAEIRLVSGTTFYGVQLAGATFHNGGGWGFPLNSFEAAVSGNDIVMFVEDSGAPAVVEEISPRTYVAYTATARTSASTASTISAALDGWIEFCALKSPMSGPYACRVEDRADPTPGQPVTYRRCTSTNHQIVLTRK